MYLVPTYPQNMESAAWISTKHNGWELTQEAEFSNKNNSMETSKALQKK